MSADAMEVAHGAGLHAFGYVSDCADCDVLRHESEPETVGVECDCDDCVATTVDVFSVGEGTIDLGSLAVGSYYDVETDDGSFFFALRYVGRDDSGGVVFFGGVHVTYAPGELVSVKLSEREMTETTGGTMNAIRVYAHDSGAPGLDATVGGPFDVAERISGRRAISATVVDGYANEPTGDPGRYVWVVELGADLEPTVEHVGSESVTLRLATGQTAVAHLDEHGDVLFVAVGDDVGEDLYRWRADGWHELTLNAAARRVADDALARQLSLAAEAVKRETAAARPVGAEVLELSEEDLAVGVAVGHGADVDFAASFDSDGRVYHVEFDGEPGAHVPGGSFVRDPADDVWTVEGYADGPPVRASSFDVEWLDAVVTAVDAGIEARRGRFAVERFVTTVERFDRLARELLDDWRDLPEGADVGARANAGYPFAASFDEVVHALGVWRAAVREPDDDGPARTVGLRTVDRQPGGTVTVERGVLSLGELRRITDPLPDDAQVVLAHDGWYVNVESVGVPATTDGAIDFDAEGEWACLTFFGGTSFDARQL